MMSEDAPSSESVAIRLADASDAGAIAAVHVASWRTTYAGIVDQDYLNSLSVDERANGWRRRLSVGSHSASDTLVLSVSTPGIVGFASGGPIREPQLGFDAELYAIYLLAEFQGLGLGRRLVREWAVLALARGHHAAIVRVLAANSARTFYEHLGAQHVKENLLTIGAREYREVWYGWRDLRDVI